MTQREMAKRLGISQPTLARLENADLNTTLKTLAQIAGRFTAARETCSSRAG